MRFIHSADIHLGYAQYNSPERYNDFARAFERLVDDALRRRVDFLLIAGDLFHQRSIEPRTLFQAATCLERLRAAHIPVLAIEGNHEKPYTLERFSWLDYLAEVGLLTLLSPTVGADGRCVLDPCEGNVGAYRDLPGGVRVVGMKYYGGSTARMIPELARALAEMPGPRPAYTILMLHLGLEGVLEHYAGTLKRADLEPLRPYADYLALGHIHKPYIQNEWLYNPGSLETNSVDEAQWEERGYFLVELDLDRRPAHRVTPIRGQRRAFERLRFAVDAYDAPETLFAALEAYLRREATPERVARQPVVELQVVGALAFDAAALERARIEALLEESFHPLVRLVRDLTTPNAFEIRPDETLTRAELEQSVLEALVARDERFRAASKSWAECALALKRLALEGATPETIVAELRERFAKG